MAFSFDSKVFISPTDFSRLVFGVDDATTTLSAVEVANVEMLVGAAAGALVDYLDRNILQASYLETFDGIGADAIMLREGPVTNVTSVKIAGDGVFTSQKNLVDERGAVAWNAEGDVHLRLGVFPRGRQVVQIGYTAGWALADVPRNLRMGLVAQYKYLEAAMNPGDRGAGAWLGVDSRSKMGETEKKDVGIGDHGIPKEVIGWIRAYRRFELPTSIQFMRVT